MDKAAADHTGGAIGRESELAGLESFLDSRLAARAFVLTGGPGIGKTTLWEAGIDAAREQGVRVLSARASGAEAQLAYAALIDLLDDVGTEELAELPPPQLSALEVATLRTAPTETPPEATAIAVGFLNALRALAGSGRLLVAVDDIQWLDPPSAEALAFAARRLEDETVHFLLAKRPGPSSPLEQALERRGLELLEVGSLSLGATRRLLAARLGLALPRRLLVRIFESAQGNPYFALELGRTLVDRELPELGEELPFPETLEELLGSRIAQLSPEASTVLLAIALSTDLRVSQLESLADASAIEEALDAGVVAADGDRLRPAHPLLGAAALGRSRPRQREELHRALALTAGDDIRRAHHLALASAAPDPDVAAVVAAAADGAAARGARHEAVELSEAALRLTPPERPERADRLLALGEHLAKAGEPERVTALLEPEVAALPRGTARARAWLLLADGKGVSTQEEYLQHLDRALAESGDDDAGLRAEVLAMKANDAAAVHIARLPEAEAWALEALEHAQHAGPDVEQLALYALAWVASFRGRPIDELVERTPSRGAALYLRASLERVECDRFAWRGQVREARAIASRLMSAADERGESRSYLSLLSQLCEIELRAGELDAASKLLDEWEQSSSDRFVAPVYERCRSLVAAYRGRPDEAKQWVADVIARSERLGKGWDLLEGLRARGIAELFAHEAKRAKASLHRVWRYTTQEGIDDPGAFPVAPDLVQALIELGEPDEAQAVTNRLRELAERQEHPWGLVTAKRCDALIRLAAPRYDEQTAADLVDAAAEYSALGLRFDRARVLLTLGGGQRRLRKWGAARASLEQAASAFDEIGSTGWADAARSELARVGGRRPRAEDELTEAEQQVVELAVGGLSNKEIAQSLVVTVSTVEAHLSRAYAKLGVRSRAQLARRLST